MTQGAMQLRDKISYLIQTVDWDQFKSEKVLIPSIEVKALLINAVKKTDKMISRITEDTINDKE